MSIAAGIKNLKKNLTEHRRAILFEPVGPFKLKKL